MHKIFLRVLVLAGILLPGTPQLLSAQQVEQAAAAAEADTLSVPGRPSAEDRLKAKLDSLRQALTENPERRRQSVARRMATADSLHRVYDFTSEVDLLKSLAAFADSAQAVTIDRLLRRGNTAMKMTSSVSMVRTTARGSISREDFLSMFPTMNDSTEWRFHALSRDGRSMYFTSKERAGAGGYDLYVTRRDRSTGKWGEPVNLGFPFSSPSNDILFAETGDGRNFVLVSDRYCPQDSLNIYVIAFDPVPPKRAMDDARGLRTLASLEPVRRAVPRRSRTSVDMSAYTARNAEARAIRDSLSAATRELNALREELPEDELAEKEKALEGLRGRLEAANKELQEIELAFLAAGVRQNSPMPEDDYEYAAAAGLIYVSEDGQGFLELDESGMLSRILPEGSVEEYAVLPPAPVFRVRATVPKDASLPWYAATVIRLHTGTFPSVTTEEGATVYTAGPLHERLRAESLMMALRATGVEDVSLIED
jgi:uncharacterized lipoprotein NlpE involved in copper resistance